MAKERFLKAADSFHVLGIVQKKPKSSLACAFLLGLGTPMAANWLKSSTLIPLAFDVGAILAREALSKR